MRTNIDIDERLIQEAMEVASLTTKKETVSLALEEFVARHRRKDLRELFGQVKFAPDYDYKAAREGTHS